MITWSSEHLAALREYLGETSVRYNDTELQRVFEVEATAQASACVIAAPAPATLVEALYRRIARNLALRRYPTGVDTLASDGGVAVMRLGSRDPEVARLEAPYRKWLAL